jgi:hypothetical protein
MKTLKFAALAGILGLTVAANATFYTSEASFLAAINATYYLEDFSGMTYGSVNAPSWTAPGANGYGWTVSATSGMYSNTSSMSTNVANEAMVVTFSGLPVTAFGGRIGNGDIGGNWIANSVTTLTMSNGDTMSINTNTESFLGWVGGPVVTSASITSTGSVDGNNWANLDHAYTGAATTVPEPATMAVLGLGALAMLRRRKKA